MSYICESCGGPATVFIDDGEPVSICCEDYVLDGTRRLTSVDYHENRRANQADNDRRAEREGGLE